jgi:hypothetical protein
LPFATSPIRDFRRWLHSSQFPGRSPRQPIRDSGNGSEIAKRIDIAAAAIFNAMPVDSLSDLDLSYTPPLGSPWDALQHGAQARTNARSAARG